MCVCVCEEGQEEREREICECSSLATNVQSWYAYLIQKTAKSYITVRLFPPCQYLTEVLRDSEREHMVSILRIHPYNLILSWDGSFCFFDWQIYLEPPQITTIVIWMKLPCIFYLDI